MKNVELNKGVSAKDVKFINMVEGQKYNVVDHDIEIPIDEITIEKDGNNLIISYVGGEYVDENKNGLGLKFELDMDLIRASYLYRVESELKYKTLAELSYLTVQQVYDVTNYMHEYVMENEYLKNDNHVSKASYFLIK